MVALTGPGQLQPEDLRLAVFAQSAVKPRNDSYPGGNGRLWRASEDRFHIARGADGMVAAVADGAGASGLFCGAWAEALVTRLPDRPIVDLPGLDGWLAGFSLDFRKAYGGRAAADPAKRAKFIREGSCAALAACWLDQAAGVPSVAWMAYGDSPVMVFDLTAEHPRLLACHPDQLAAFDRDPHLLNWRDLPVAAGLRVGRIDLPAKAAVILATDAIGLFLLCRHFAGGGAGCGDVLAGEFLRLGGGDSRLSAAARAHRADVRQADIIADLRRHLASPEDFSAMIRRRCEEGLLANDDATVVMIEVEIPLPAEEVNREQAGDEVVEQASGDAGRECHCRPTENPGS